MKEELKKITLEDNRFRGYVDLAVKPEELRLLKQKEGSTCYIIEDKFGFIEPSRITNYGCKECGSDLSPDTLKTIVNIYRPETMHALGEIHYYCAKCNSGVLGMFIFDKDMAKSIDPHYITFDGTGDFVKPTKKSIEERLTKAFDEAKQGTTDRFYSEHFETAKTWAEKIGYTIPPDLFEKLKDENAKAYISHMQEELPETLEELLREDYLFGYTGRGGDEVDEGFDMVFEKFFKIYDNLPKLKIKPEIKGKLNALLTMYEKRHKDIHQALTEKNIELQKKADEELKILKEISDNIEKYAK